MLYGEISVSEMETRYISLSIFLAMQYPSILSTLYMLFLILSSSKKSKPFLLGDYHSQYHGVCSQEITSFGVKFLSAIYFMFLLYHFKYFIVFLGFLSFCCLLAVTSSCTLPVHLLPHEEKVGTV